jgi:hypothetical protein
LNVVLPLFLAGLAKNASTESGAESLNDALQKDHDGSVFNQLDDVLQNPGSFKAEKIIQHVFGENQNNILSYIGANRHINTDKAQELLSKTAPLLMGALGQIQKEENLDAQGLALQLNEGVSHYNPLLTMLDSNKDGQIHDDILRSIWNFIKKMFGREVV